MCPEGTTHQASAPHAWLEEATIAELAEDMATGRRSAVELTVAYLERIAALDGRLHAIIETNPDAIDIAERRDRERAAGDVRSPLHGIPVVLKDNIDTADRMATTAGSLALVGSQPAGDATAAARLRTAGAVILAKTNLSEWANFRSTRSSSGWSARGGQVRNPYVLDRTPWGSSSGSAVAVSTNMATIAVGTESDGSIVAPAAVNGVVGLKPTVGLVSRSGVIPVADSQDSVGPIARTVRDAAVLLDVLAGADPRDPATTRGSAHVQASYGRFVRPDGLRGARIGVARNLAGFNPPADRVLEDALVQMRKAGAEVVDPADIPSVPAFYASDAELQVFLHEFKAGINTYLPSRGAPAPNTLAELIAFNEAHPSEELCWFGQEAFEAAQRAGSLDDPVYREALARGRRLARDEGLDTVLEDPHLDALVAPTGPPAWPIDLINGDPRHGSTSSMAAVAGYPLITVPAGSVHGLPVGITFMGRAWSEPTLLRVAAGFERATAARTVPSLRPTLLS